MSQLNVLARLPELLLQLPLESTQMLPVFSLESLHELLMRLGALPRLSRLSRQGDRFLMSLLLLRQQLFLGFQLLGILGLQLLGGVSELLRSPLQLLLKPNQLGHTLTRLRLHLLAAYVCLPPELFGRLRLRTESLVALLHLCFELLSLPLLPVDWCVRRPWHPPDECRRGM